MVQVESKWRNTINSTKHCQVRRFEISVILMGTVNFLLTSAPLQNRAEERSVMVSAVSTGQGAASQSGSGAGSSPPVRLCQVSEDWDVLVP